MTRPAAFVGAFTAASPNAPGQPMVARITLPRGEFDPFVRTIGMPRWPVGPAIALLPCQEPVQRDAARGGDPHPAVPGRGVRGRRGPARDLAPAAGRGGDLGRDVGGACDRPTRGCEAMSVSRLLVMPLDRAGDPPVPIRTRVNREGDAYRLALDYVWDRAEPILPWVMLNPGYAGTRTPYDQTARRVIRWSWRWGFGGALLLNAAPVIAPRTRDLRTWLDGIAGGDIDARDALWRNHHALRTELAPHEAAMVGWGASHLAWPQLAAYGLDLVLEQAFDAINDPAGPRQAVLRTFCLGLTQGGRPLHPMARGRHRVPDDARPIPFPDHPGTIRSLGEAA